MNYLLGSIPIFAAALGSFGFMEGMPYVAGGGFTISAIVQIAIMKKFGPITRKLVSHNERLIRLEDFAKFPVRSHDFEISDDK